MAQDISPIIEKGASFFPGLPFGVVKGNPHGNQINRLNRWDGYVRSFGVEARLKPKDLSAFDPKLRPAGVSGTWHAERIFFFGTYHRGKWVSDLAKSA